MTPDQSLARRLHRSVEELELSVRSYNCLKSANIRTVRELVQKTETELLNTGIIGRKPLNEIKEILTSLGLSLGTRLETTPTQPLRIYFDASALDEVEIAEVLGFLSDLYRTVGGDGLVINRITAADTRTSPEPVLA